MALHMFVRRKNFHGWSVVFVVYLSWSVRGIVVFLLFRDVASRGGQFCVYFRFVSVNSCVILLFFSIHVSLLPKRQKSSGLSRVKVDRWRRRRCIIAINCTMHKRSLISIWIWTLSRRWMENGRNELGEQKTSVKNDIATTGFFTYVYL